MPEIDQTISHHKILEKLGGGDMGEVNRAEDTRDLRSSVFEAGADLTILNAHPTRHLPKGTHRIWCRMRRRH